MEYKPENDSGILVVECKDHIVTRTIVGDTLLLVAYVCGVYLFRYGEPEHLSALMERVRGNSDPVEFFSLVRCYDFDG